MRVVNVADPQPRDRAGRRPHCTRPGVNPVDAYMRSGKYARLPDLPYTPGSDGAGIVKHVGEGVTGCAAGDRVYVAALGVRLGTYAEQHGRAPRASVHPLPDAQSRSARARRSAFRPRRPIARWCIRAQARAGETVLVHGASGGVGIAAVQLARGAGPARHRHRRQRAGACAPPGAAGAARRAEPSRGWLRGEAMPEATGGKGVDVMLEMLANVNLDKDLGLLAPRGRVVVDRQPRAYRNRPASDDGEGVGGSGHDPLGDDARGDPADSRGARSGAGDRRAAPARRPRAAARTGGGGTSRDPREIARLGKIVLTIHLRGDSNADTT